MELSSWTTSLLALAGDGHGADVAEAAQAVVVLARQAELDDLQRAAQVHVEAALLRLAVERGGAVDDRIGGRGQAA